MNWTIHRLLKTIVIMCLLGLISSIYLTYEHYSLKSSLCDFTTHVSCSLVNASVFSEIFHTPVALFGVLWFLVALYLCFTLPKKEELLRFFLLWNILGILSVVYFVVAEFILRTICPLCTLIHLLIIAILIVTLILHKKQEFKFSLNKSLQVGKPLLVKVIPFFLFLLLLFNYFAPEEGINGGFAQCLTEKGVKMYSSFRCGICLKTEELFGSSFHYIKKIECHPSGPSSQTDLCVDKEISGTPTWVLEVDGVEIKRHAGFLSLEQLGVFAGCPYPGGD